MISVVKLVLRAAALRISESLPTSVVSGARRQSSISSSGDVAKPCLSACFSSAGRSQPVACGASPGGRIAVWLQSARSRSRPCSSYRDERWRLKSAQITGGAHGFSVHTIRRVLRSACLRYGAHRVPHRRKRLFVFRPSRSAAMRGTSLESTTFSDTIATVRRWLWSDQHFQPSETEAEMIKVPRSLLERLTETPCYAA